LQFDTIALPFGFPFLTSNMHTAATHPRCNMLIGLQLHGFNFFLGSIGCLEEGDWKIAFPMRIPLCIQVSVTCPPPEKKIVLLRLSMPVWREREACKCTVTVRMDAIC
jgi:hypothetical protein